MLAEARVVQRSVATTHRHARQIGFAEFLSKGFHFFAGSLQSTEAIKTQFESLVPDRSNFFEITLA
jgi:hypothetical protein